MVKVFVNGSMFVFITLSSFKHTIQLIN